MREVKARVGLESALVQPLDFAKFGVEFRVAPLFTVVFARAHDGRA